MRERTRGNSGFRRKSTAACRKMSRSAKVARRKGSNYEGPSVEQGRRKNKTRNKTARGTRIGRRQLLSQEGTNGTRNRDVKEQLRLGTGVDAGFLRVLQFPLTILIPPTASHSSSSIIRVWYNKTNSGRRTKCSQSHPTPRN
jgi:hypothetical protein